MLLPIKICKLVTVLKASMASNTSRNQSLTNPATKKIWKNLTPRFKLETHANGLIMLNGQKKRVSNAFSALIFCVHVT
jgi:hypothetical protein